MKVQWGSRRIALLCLEPRRLMKVDGQHHTPATLPLGKRLAGRAPGLVWTGAENLAHAGIFFLNTFLYFPFVIVHK